MEGPGYFCGNSPLYERRNFEMENKFRNMTFEARMMQRYNEYAFFNHINDEVPFQWKQVEFLENKVRFDFNVVEVEKKDDKIYVHVENQPTEVKGFTEEQFQKTLDFWLNREGNTTESFVIWEPHLIKYTRPIQITYCLSICKQPESWDFLKLFTGKLQFLPILCTVDMEVMKAPIIAGSQGITLYGNQPNDVIFASNHYYFINKNHVVSISQLKDIYEHWKSIKREEGMFSFDCSPETYKEYKEQIKTWAKHFNKPVYGLYNGIQKGLCLDFHSDKQIVFIFGKSADNEKTQLVMAIHDRDISDIAAEFLQKLHIVNPIISIAKSISK